MKEPPKLLVVDDQPNNLKLLKFALEQAGMEVSVAASGAECLRLTRAYPPDLILLDVPMPEMDGIETCRELQKAEDTQLIPVIMVTAESSREGKLSGLEAGAVDYITKPIDLQETLARINTQLRVQKIHRRNLDLQQRLAETRETATVGAITQGLTHNLNNLLGVVVGYLDILKRTFDEPDRVKCSTALIEQSVERMVEIVRQLSNIASSEKAALSSIQLQSLLESSVERYQIEHDIIEEVEIDNPLKELAIDTNAEIFEGIVGKLLINAYESYPPNNNSRHIGIQTEFHDQNGKSNVLIRITDKGSGIEECLREQVFEPFISSKETLGRGMGLTIARHTIRNLNGELHLKPGPNGGTTAELTHPV